MLLLPGRFPRLDADVPKHASGAFCRRGMSLARGAALVAVALLLSACPDVKPPKDPRYIPHPKIEQPEESDMKKTRSPNTQPKTDPNRSPVSGDDSNAPAGAQAGRQIGRQGQRASQQDPSMNPRTLVDGQWREASETPKDKSNGG